IEIDDVRIDVVEKRPLRQQSKRNSKAATKGLNEPLARVALPVFNEMGNLPPLAAGPFQRGPDSLRGGCDFLYALGCGHPDVQPLYHVAWPHEPLKTKRFWLIFSRVYQ